jgi:hypothetical protein
MSFFDSIIPAIGGIGGGILGNMIAPGLGGVLGAGVGSSLGSLAGGNQSNPFTGTQPGPYSQTGELTPEGRYLWDKLKGDLMSSGPRSFGIKVGNTTVPVMAPYQKALMAMMDLTSTRERQNLGYQPGAPGMFDRMGVMLSGLDPQILKDIMNGTGTDKTNYGIPEGNMVMSDTTTPYVPPINYFPSI